VDDRLCGLGGPSDHPITRDRDAIFNATERRLRFRGFSRSDRLHISGAFTEVCVAANAPAGLVDAAFRDAIWYVVDPAIPWIFPDGKPRRITVTFRDAPHGTSAT
jgi:hypothetical protein